jgi:PucR family transcriptional regulator, purine catabolism regulatory protein
VEQPGAMTDQTAVQLAEVLAAPPLALARVVAGAAVVATTTVVRTSVIEREATCFVRPGELVMTTGVGHNEEELSGFLVELVASAAAAVLVSLPPHGPVPGIPQRVLEAADACGKPIIDLPWEVAFSEVSEWLEEVHLARVGADVVHARFTKALLDGLGATGVAAALEATIDRPVLAFDALLQPIAHGPLAESVLGRDGLRTVAARSTTIDPATVARLVEDAATPDPRPLPGLEALGIGAGVAVAAQARHQVVGVLYVLGKDVGATGRHVLRLAADALAIDCLRRRSAADSDARDRERDELLWELARSDTEPTDRALHRAATHGLDLRASYDIGIAIGGESTLRAVTRAISRASLHAGTTLFASVRDGLLLAVAVAPNGRVLRQLIGTTTGEHDAIWGIAARPRPLLELGSAFAEARQALELGRTRLDRCEIADAAELAPHLMLSTLAHDPTALGIAHGVIHNLLAHDARRANLLDTLDVYLQEGGNASAAARRLCLNRHSLHYRLRRIEELTGRALSDASDRFILQLCLQLVRLGVLKGPSAP